MTIERVANHGIPYLRLTTSLGLKRVGERIVQRRKVVLGLGLLSRHDDGKPDYLLRLRESFRMGKPLIKELEPYEDVQLLFKAYGIDIPAKIYTKGDIRELKSSVNPF